MWQAYGQIPDAIWWYHLKDHLAYKRAYKGKQAGEERSGSRVEDRGRGGFEDPEVVALFNVSYARFVRSLNSKERGYFEARLEELDWAQIERFRIAHRNEQAGLRGRIRRKFERHFS